MRCVTAGMRLFGNAALGLGLACVATGCGAADASDVDSLRLNRIQQENEYLGTRDFRVQQSAANHEIEAYASSVSAQPGESVDIAVNADRDATFDWALYRLGYYRGDGARLVLQGSAVAVAPQPACPIDPTTGLIECAWSPALSLTIDPSWISGYYLFKLTRDDGFETRVPLVVREATQSAGLLMQASVNTWQAYNDWGGDSLYRNDLGADAVYTPAMAHQVSFDRPYLNDDGVGFLFDQEAWMVSWLEQKGYDVAYVTNVDVDRDPGLLKGRKMFLSVGHDEYHSLPERDALEAARDEGLSLGFLTANASYWRVRYDASSSGVARRIITCYKSATLDPKINAPDTTNLYRAGPDPRPENGMIGVMYSEGSSPDTDLPLIVSDPTHWIFEGTGVGPNERLANVLGSEWDAVGYNAESPASIQIVFGSPAVSSHGSVGYSNGTVYYPTTSSVVFASGTLDWALALGRPDLVDSRIQRITENVFARAGLPPLEWTHPSPPPREVGNAAEVSLIAGSGVAGHRDGAAEQAQFNAPSGVAAAADGTLYVTEARNHSVRAIATDGTVTTLAGCGPYNDTAGKYKEGSGTGACFNAPTGIVVGADGNIYVSDTGNSRIRRVTPSGHVTTFAGSRGGFLDAPQGKNARFLEPRGIALGPDGALYVVEPKHGTLRRIDPSSAVTTVASSLEDPTGVSVGADGTIYLASTDAGSILRIQNNRVQIVANQAQELGDASGTALDAHLRPAEGMLAEADRVVFSDMGNYRVRELVLGNPDIVDTVAGTGGAGQALGDGSNAELVLPRGITRYKDGYAVADTGNHRIVYVRPPRIERRTFGRASSTLELYLPK